MNATSEIDNVNACYVCEGCERLYYADELYHLSVTQKATWLCAKCLSDHPAYIQWHQAISNYDVSDKLSTFAELVERKEHAPKLSL